ncbi:hypothetical protein BO71DRAFT_429932 [Aspergillus ellipticus CBS 707.79]|uniref:Uncharacterized protein n=1 Tax=Aspergillus ellipticus CBS 707.79 TaxID=1448320 RepID=A0A319DK08_9EURO|nr:hypothetical protein BO71DRAFT_429932 [Aspergillus ellipticus CBS 707.79]
MHWLSTAIQKCKIAAREHLCFPRVPCMEFDNSEGDLTSMRPASSSLWANELPALSLSHYPAPRPIMIAGILLHNPLIHSCFWMPTAISDAAEIPMKQHSFTYFPYGQSHDFSSVIFSTCSDGYIQHASTIHSFISQKDGLTAARKPGVTLLLPDPTGFTGIV